jgi:hypothetical protein
LVIRNTGITPCKYQYMHKRTQSKILLRSSLSQTWFQFLLMRTA